MFDDLLILTDSLSLIDGVNILYILILSIVINYSVKFILTRYIDLKKYSVLLVIVYSLVLVLLTVDYSIGLRLIVLNYILVCTVSTFNYDLLHQLLKKLNKDK